MTQFKMETLPSAYQLTIHLNNLFRYFNPENTNGRMWQDIPHSMSTSRLIELTKSMCHTPYLNELYLLSRHSYPIEFRIASIIKHYGSDVVLGYINLIYGQKVG